MQGQIRAVEKKPGSQPPARLVQYVLYLGACASTASSTDERERARDLSLRKGGVCSYGRERFEQVTSHQSHRVPSASSQLALFFSLSGGSTMGGSPCPCHPIPTRLSTISAPSLSLSSSSKRKRTPQNCIGPMSVAAACCCQTDQTA